MWAAGPGVSRAIGRAGLNISFNGVDAEALMESMPRIALSSSSACTTASMQPSYVLAALGHDEERIEGSIRFSLGRFTIPFV